MQVSFLRRRRRLTGICTAPKQVVQILASMVMLPCRLFQPDCKASMSWPRCGSGVYVCTCRYRSAVKGLGGRSCKVTAHMEFLPFPSIPSKSPAHSIFSLRVQSTMAADAAEFIMTEASKYDPAFGPRNIVFSQQRAEFGPRKPFQYVMIGVKLILNAYSLVAQRLPRGSSALSSIRSEASVSAGSSHLYME